MPGLPVGPRARPVSPSTAPGTPGAQPVAAVPEEVGEARLIPELSPAPGNQGRPPRDESLCPPLKGGREGEKGLFG